MADLVDLVIEFNGGADSSRIGTAAAGSGSLRISDAQKQAYSARQAAQPAPRRLVHVIQGIQHKMPPGQSVTVAALSHAIGVVERLLATRAGIMSVCIAGCSAGSWYVLLMAEELSKRGIRTTVAVACDFPIFPFGIDASTAPPPGCGRMIPTNEPEWLRLGSYTPPRAKNAPEVQGPTPSWLAGAERLNYYQLAGNGMAVLDVRKHFSPTNSFWWWNSNMHGNEIHGRLSGWFNIPVTVDEPRINDDACHSAGDDIGMRLAGENIMSRLMG